MCAMENLAWPRGLTTEPVLTFPIFPKSQNKTVDIEPTRASQVHVNPENIK